MDIIAEIKNDHIQVRKIDLSPLRKMDVKHLITDFLKCSKKKGDTLGKLVHEKTNGNPFFVNQFLKALYDEKYIKFDVLLGWLWDLDQINQMQVTDNVVTLLAKKMNKLPVLSLEILKFCACIGSKFDLETLSFLLFKPIDDVLNDLYELMNGGYFTASGSLYKFQHDRIHEAAYSLISDEEKKRSALYNWYNGIG